MMEETPGNDNRRRRASSHHLHTTTSMKPPLCETDLTVNSSVKITTDTEEMINIMGM